MDYLRPLKIKIDNFRQLPGDERWILIQALVMLPLVALTLRLSGLGFTRKLLTHLSPETIPCTPSSSYEEDKEELLLLQQANKISRLVNTAACYQQPWASCLTKSLLLWWLLRFHYIASNLQIGVRREDGKFEAHAWVECLGQVLNDRDDVRQRFAVFELPVQSRGVVR